MPEPTDYPEMIRRARQAGEMPPLYMPPHVRALGNVVAPDLTRYLAETAPSMHERLRGLGGDIRGPGATLIPGPGDKLPTSGDPRQLPAVFDAMMLAGNVIGPKSVLAAAPIAAKVGAKIAKSPLTMDMVKPLTGKNAAQTFHDALAAAKEANPHGKAVDLKSVEDLSKKGTKLFLTDDKMAGGIVEPNGTLSAVFKHPDAPYSDALPAITQRAVKAGADRLDAYDVGLPEKYAAAGDFQPVAKMAFSKAALATGVDPEAFKATFKNFTGKTPTWAAQLPKVKTGGPGEPDLVAMVRNPPKPVQPLEVGNLYGEDAYAKAMRLQDLAMEGRMPQEFIPQATRSVAPGIYQKSKDVVRDALKQVGREDPALKEVFNLSRDDIYGMAQDRERAGLGNLPPPTLPQNPRGSEIAQAIMTPHNEQRYVEALNEARKHPEILHGGYGWYIQDPHYQGMVKEYGRDFANKNFPLFEITQGFSSPASAVNQEVRRGTLAWRALNEGWFPDWVRWGAGPGGRPPEIAAKIPEGTGTLAHQSQVVPMSKLFERMGIDTTKPLQPQLKEIKDPQAWQHMLTSIKTGPYTSALMVPETGFSWRFPTLDSHMMRNTGAADVRGGKTTANWGSSVSEPEAAQLAPWFSGAARQAGMNPVGAQGVGWTLFGPHTGVESALGAPKLELQARLIKDRALATGKSVEQVKREGWAGKENWMLPLVAAPAGGATLKDILATPPGD